MNDQIELTFPAGTAEMQIDHTQALQLHELGLAGQRGRIHPLLPIPRAEIKLMMKNLRGIPQYWACDKPTGTVYVWPVPTHDYKLIGKLKIEPEIVPVKRDAKATEAAADRRA